MVLEHKAFRLVLHRLDHDLLFIQLPHQVLCRDNKMSIADTQPMAREKNNKQLSEQVLVILSAWRIAQITVN